MSTVRSDRRALTKLRRDLKVLVKGRAQVGLFAEKSMRSDGETNPQIGAYHEQPKDMEFGSIARKLPQRSFLRMPLMTQLTPQRLNKIPWYRLLLRDGPKKLLTRFGLMGEEVVQEAFSTGGYGNWKELSQSTINRKGTTAILIDKAEMRKAVDSRVVLP